MLFECLFIYVSVQTPCENQRTARGSQFFHSARLGAGLDLRSEHLTALAPCSLLELLICETPTRPL